MWRERRGLESLVLILGGARVKLQASSAELPLEIASGVHSKVYSSSLGLGLGYILKLHFLNTFQSQLLNLVCHYTE